MLLQLPSFLEGYLVELHARPPRSLLGNISHGGTSAGTRPPPFGAAPDLWSLDTLSPAERGALTGDKRMLSDLNCGCLPTGEGSDEETVVQFNRHDRNQLFCGYSQKIRKDQNYCLHGNSPAVRFT